MSDTGPVGPPFGQGGGGLSFKAAVQALVNIPISLNQILIQLKNIFPSTAWTSSGSATAGGATLPANPVGFFNVVDSNGVSRRIPYYNP